MAQGEHARTQLGYRIVAVVVVVVVVAPVALVGSVASGWRWLAVGGGGARDGRDEHAVAGIFWVAVEAEKQHRASVEPAVGALRTTNGKPPGASTPLQATIAHWDDAACACQTCDLLHVAGQ